MSFEVVFTKPGTAKIVPVNSSENVGLDMLGIQGLYSGISWGTESKFLKNEVNPLLNEDDAFSSSKLFPARHGYCHIGQIIKVGEGVQKNLHGKRVFSFSNHTGYKTLKENQVTILPENLPARRATLIPNMETAISVLCDAQPIIGTKVLLIGLGVLGQLCHSLLTKLPLIDLRCIDTSKDRQNLAKKVDKQIKLTSWDDLDHFKPDVVLEFSGNTKALQQAFTVCSQNARIIIGSWYGDNHANISLNSKFHRKRLQLISSQVSSMRPDYKEMLSHQQRIQIAIDELLKNKNLDHLITHQVEIEQADLLYEKMKNQPQKYGHCIIHYGEKNNLNSSHDFKLEL